MTHILQKIGVFLAGSSLGVLLFFGMYRGVPTLLAETPSTVPPAATNNTDTPPVTAPQTPADQRCSAAFPAFAEQEKATFLNFMNKHFKNAAPNSDLLPVGLDRLKQYRAALQNKHDSFLSQAGSQVQTLNEIAYCDQLLRTQLAIAETVFEGFVEDTAYSKRSTALSQKLQLINGKLRGLHDLFGQLDSSFVKFGNKLPAFTQQCLPRK